MGLSRRPSGSGAIPRCQVRLNGAFFTGLTLRFRSTLGHTMYAARQEPVLRALECADEVGWRPSRMADPEEPQFGFRRKYPKLMPRSFLHRQSAELTGEVMEVFQRAPLESPTVLGIEHFTIDSARIDIYEFGIGSLAIGATLDGNQPVALREIRRFVEALGEAVITELAALVDRSVAPLHRVEELTANRDEELTLGPGAGQQRAEASQPKVERLEWLHRTYIVEPPHVASARTAVDDLFPSDYAEHEFQNMDFFPGLGSTAILCRDYTALERDSLWSVSAIGKLMDLQWAYIAAALALDRALFRDLRELAGSEAGARISGLRAQRERVIRLHGRVRLFRATIGSFLIDLGGGSGTIWAALGAVQSVPQLDAALDDKLASLRETHDTLFNEQALRQQSRLTATLSAFAAFGFVASTAAVASFIFSVQSDLQPDLRKYLVAGAAAVAVTAWLVSRRLVHRAITRGFQRARTLVIAASSDRS